MLPYLNLGPIGLPTAPLAIIFGAWLSLYLVDRAARRLGNNPETLYGLAATTLVAGFVGARLSFVLLHWSSFDDNLLGIVWPLTSGYSGAGAAAFALAAAFFYIRWKQLPIWSTLDCLAPGIVVWLMTLSLADFLGGPGYGTLTQLPWGISSFGVRRHPVQLYEMLAGLAALASWWFTTTPKRYPLSHAGRPFLTSLAVYTAGRLFVEAYRDNAWFMTGGVHVVQLISLLILLGCLALLAIKSAESRPVLDDTW